MTVYRLYKNKPFEPEALAAMTRAYADICRELGLNEGDRPEIHAVAKKVIEFAQRGDHDPVRLRDHVLQALAGRIERADCPGTAPTFPR